MPLYGDSQKFTTSLTTTLLRPVSSPRKVRYQPVDRSHLGLTHFPESQQRQY